MFAIGDIVMHPGHGICRIIGSKKEASDGTEFYSLKPIKTANGIGIIMVPQTNAAENGLRALIPSEEVNAVLDIIESAPGEIQVTVGTVQDIKNLIRKSDLKKTAEVLRDLVKNESVAFTKETEILIKNAKERIASEISYVSGLPFSQVERMVLARLKKNI